VTGPVLQGGQQEHVKVALERLRLVPHAHQTIVSYVGMLLSGA